MAVNGQRPKSSRPGSAIYLGNSESPKLPNGFASVQVGLGSPRFDFGKRNASGDMLAAIPGLPSPPNTESDIALPVASASSSKPPLHATASSSRIPRASPSKQTSPVLQRTPSLARSSSISSTTSSRKIRPKTSPGLSMSQSSTSSSRLSALVPNSAERQRSASGTQGAPSPARLSQQHSPSSTTPKEKSARRTSKRMSGSWESGLADEAIQEEADRAGLELDERIRQAEEKIRHANNRRRSGDDVTSPPKATIRRHDSYTRTFGARASPTSNPQATLRRSATLTSASAWPDTPDKTPDVEQEEVLMDVHQRDRSGGSSGSGRRKPLPTEFRSNTGLFTPSPKPSSSSGIPTRGSASSSRPSRITASEEPMQSSPAPSRFATIRSQRAISSDVQPKYRHSMDPDGLPRNATLKNRQDVSGYTRRQWSESISGLPQVDRLDQRGSPSPRDRLRGDLSLSNTPDRARYSSGRQPLTTRSSRTPLRPQDSVSAVGTRSEHTNTPPSTSKDPLEVLRRMEDQRAIHNNKWEHDRAASVIGEASRSPRRANTGFPRPATSMSSLRDRLPTTAPLDRVRRWSPDFPSPSRAFSRTAHIAPATEPRPMRSSTSLGGRPGTSLSIDPSAALTEHCRLLFEALRALELKLSPEMLASHPDILRTFLSSTKNLESMNVSLRAASTLVTDLGVQLELEDHPSRNDFNRIADMIRDNAKASDQTVRDLTRIMLDLPKLLREGTRMSVQPDSMRSRRSESISSYVSTDPVEYDRWSRSPEHQINGHVDSPLDSRPIRQSTEMLRPVTSIGSIPSPSRYRDSFQTAQSFRTTSRRDRPSTVSSVASKARGSFATRSTISDDPLDPIAASQPSASNSRMPSGAYSRATAPDAGRQHRVLKKKASSASTNTVRGSSFLPSTARRTTTAISTINAGAGEESPPSKSLVGWNADQDIDHEPRRQSFYSSRTNGPRRSDETDRTDRTDQSRQTRESDEGHQREIRLDTTDEEFSGGSFGQEFDPIAVLEQRLASAAKAREERASIDGSAQGSVDMERKKSLTERFKDTLRGGRV